jgi:hypothetical protein
LIKTYLIEVQRTKQDRKVCLQIKIHWLWIIRKDMKLTNHMIFINLGIRSYPKIKMKNC